MYYIYANKLDWHSQCELKYRQNVMVIETEKNHKAFTYLRSYQRVSVLPHLEGIRHVYAVHIPNSHKGRRSFLTASIYFDSTGF